MSDSEQTAYVLPPITGEQVDALVAFLPIFTDPEFSAGEWMKRKGEFP